jgi:hypothetical protein
MLLGFEKRPELGRWSATLGRGAATGLLGRGRPKAKGRLKAQRKRKREKKRFSNLL